MKSSPAVAAIASIVVGAFIGAVIVFTGTLALTETSRPNIDRSGDADYSMLHSVDYGRTTQLQ